MKILIFLFILFFLPSCISGNETQKDSESKKNAKTTENKSTQVISKDKKEESVMSKTIGDEMVEKTVSNECVYKNYNAKAVVIKIHQTTESMNQRHKDAGFQGYEILFKITTTETIEESFAKETLNNDYLFLLNNGWYPGSKFIEKYGIKENNSYSGILKVKKSGVCDKDITFEIKEIDGYDYFEKPVVKHYYEDDRILLKKPVIYLYPEKDMNISVKVENAKLIHTYPKYDNGWNVFVTKEGKITNLKTNLEHYCLYWEGESSKNYTIDEGFVVKGDDSIKFLEEKLEIMGLNRKEINEFIIFWLPQLEQNELNMIKFINEEYNNDYPLNVSPKPDSIIRVYMIFKKIDAIDILLKEQVLKPVQRKGFSVVEWGGSELK